MDSRRQMQAQQSTNNMVSMSKRMQDITEDMHDIASRTQRETVSMRIITLVTLFFLPGTFIAVCASVLWGAAHRAHPIYRAS
jgi:Mg2+ and Co2+ transporter CorA